MKPLVLALMLCHAAACAGPVTDRIRAAGMVHCGATVRPGLAFPAPDGQWHGLEVDLCRAAAVAMLGPAARTEFHGYTLQLSSYDGVRDGSDDLSFLTASEMLYAGMLAHVLPGPPVFFDTVALMVLDGSPMRRAADLQGKRVCAEPGTGPERTLTAWFASQQVPIRFFPFQEADEMLDAFYAGRCDAIAHYRTSLAAIGMQAAADGHPARLLPEPLSAVPVMAMTPRADADWAAIAGWTMQTLLRAETAGPAGPGGGDATLPLSGAALGLTEDWQGAVLQTVGTYGDIYRRNLGDGSPLHLPRGVNALWPDGLFAPPFTE